MPLDRPAPDGLDELVSALLEETPRVEDLCDRLGPAEAHQLRVFLDLNREALRSTDRLLGAMAESLSEGQYEALADAADGKSA